MSETTPPLVDREALAKVLHDTDRRHAGCERVDWEHFAWWRVWAAEVIAGLHAQDTMSMDYRIRGEWIEEHTADGLWQPKAKVAGAVRLAEAAVDQAIEDARRRRATP